MKIQTFDNREDWLSARVGKITGTKLKDILVKRGTGEKKGFYQLIADRVAVQEEGNETPLDRGVRLEPEALERFEKETGKKLNKELVIFTRDDNENIAYSPDGFVEPKKGKKITESVEVKCLASASHIEAIITGKIPSEYVEQSLQPFIVNDDLETLYFVFYDPRIKAKDYFVITVKREEVQEDIDTYLAYEKEKLQLVENWVIKLTF